jgi:protocatechuate 3,4-dioxygenase, alpha subunit
MRLVPTPSQTVGPFFALGFDSLYIDKIASEGLAGERIAIAGRVLDGDGQAVPDAVIEIWQADSEGTYAHPESRRNTQSQGGFLGFLRMPTNEDGEFRFATVKPGRVPGPDRKLQAPHLAVSVFMRGLLKRLVTRMYFPDEAANADDLVLNLVEPARRETLIARKSSDGKCLQWNVILQGKDETVFFDC